MDTTTEATFVPFLTILSTPFNTYGLLQSQVFAYDCIVDGIDYVMTKEEAAYLSSFFVLKYLPSLSYLNLSSMCSPHLLYSVDCSLGDNVLILFSYSFLPRLVSLNLSCISFILSWWIDNNLTYSILSSLFLRFNKCLKYLAHLDISCISLLLSSMTLQITNLHTRIYSTWSSKWTVPTYLISSFIVCLCALSSIYRSNDLSVLPSCCLLWIEEEVSKCKDWPRICYE